MTRPMKLTLRSDEAIEAVDGQLIVHKYPHQLVCGCMSDATFTCDEHKPRNSK
jgi:hypothetical protein